MAREVSPPPRRAYILADLSGGDARARATPWTLPGSVSLTGLLISVRNVREAAAALRGGANWIDVKEPFHGSLGPADPRVWQQVAREVDGRAAMSVALGELLDPGLTHRLTRLPAVAFAKIGLAGCQSCADWARRWKAALRQFPPGVSPVGVAYADWLTAGAPPPDQVVATAERLGCRALLCDTFDKENGHLLNCISPDELGLLVDAARQRGMLVVLAGSLRPCDVPHIMTFGPDIVAVRGAVCTGSRAGSVQEPLVRDMVAALRRCDAHAATSGRAVKPAAGTPVVQHDHLPS